MQCWEIFEPDQLSEDQICASCADPEAAEAADFAQRRETMDKKLAEMARLPLTIIHHNPKI